MRDKMNGRHGLTEMESMVPMEIDFNDSTQPSSSRNFMQMNMAPTLEDNDGVGAAVPNHELGSSYRGLSSTMDGRPMVDETVADGQRPVYGELIVLGTNGCLPGGDRGRRKSNFILKRRQKPNGVKPSNTSIIYEKPSHSDMYSSKEHHSVFYTLPKNVVVVVAHDPTSNTDMFQIGRSTEDPIDFVVMDIFPGASIPSNNQKSHQPQQSTISRFSCRIICDRDPPYTARIYAAGFDTSMNIILGEKAPKWKVGGAMDGLTTNGILIMKPKRDSPGSIPEPSGWNEVSLNGGIFRLRETRSAQRPGVPIPNEDNILQDGTLIDLCGATLLWRSASSIQRMPTPRHIDRLIEDINHERPQCPVGLTTLAFPRRGQAHAPSEKQPWVYLSCGHVHGRIEWGRRGEERMCPLCRTVGKYVPLWMGNEPAFYYDRGPPTHCFVPCGHVCSEVTAKFWSLTPLPHGTQAFNAACPFCATQIEGDPGYVKLIWQPPQ